MQASRRIKVLTEQLSTAEVDNVQTFRCSDAFVDLFDHVASSMCSMCLPLQ